VFVLCGSTKDPTVGVWVPQRALYVTASIRTHKISFIGATPTYHFVTPSQTVIHPPCSTDGSIGTGKILNHVYMLGIEHLSVPF